MIETSLLVLKRRKRDHELKQKRTEEAVDDEELEDPKDREIATDPDEYEDVPTSGAYITIKETKPGYRTITGSGATERSGATNTLRQ